ncbi:MAG: RsmB/NOP family class I SAM-dependent RNA methyltransferase [Pseudomonadota bacterium]
MTPGARIAAAIGVLDAVAAGQPAEQALTRWGRASRYAGSKDRAAVRDHVFDALRNWRSDAVRGGGTSGRARMIGRCRADGSDLDALFDGVGHAPDPLSAAEQAGGSDPTETGARWNLPDWILPQFTASLGAVAEETALALCARAPITLRVNVARTTLSQAQQALAKDGITTAVNPRAETALSVSEGARKVRMSTAYLDGLVELQDASSQAATLSLPVRGTALDYCAGGGGKSLALAAQGWAVTAHDIDARRMRDLAERAARGGHDIALCATDKLAEKGPFDLVFCDAPCSGSGAWRRSPDAKWNLTQDRLDELSAMQRDVLDAGRALVAPGGQLVYATCSVLGAENDAQIAAFLERHPEWSVSATHSWCIDAHGDGFFAAQLTRNSD